MGDIGIGMVLPLILYYWDYLIGCLSFASVVCCSVEITEYFQSHFSRIPCISSCIPLLFTAFLFMEDINRSNFK